MRILRISEVAERTGLSSSSIYKQVRLGNFPAPKQLTERSTGWDEDDVNNWISTLIPARKVNGLGEGEST
jgi:prophage regulatory protein